MRGKALRFHMRRKPASNLLRQRGSFGLGEMGRMPGTTNAAFIATPMTLRAAWGEWMSAVCMGRPFWCKKRNQRDARGAGDLCTNLMLHRRGALDQTRGRTFDLWPPKPCGLRYSVCHHLLRIFFPRRRERWHWRSARLRPLPW